MTTSPPPSRRWIWFFAVLVVLSIAGITIPIVYNIRQQLKPEGVKLALERWQEKGPSSYTLRYVVKKPNTEPEVYETEVRRGRVVAARMNGRLLDARPWPIHSMHGLFSDIQQFLIEDARPERPRAFVRATFDATDGRVLHYLRSVSATRERVEIDLQELKPISAEPPQPVESP